MSGLGQCRGKTQHRPRPLPEFDTLFQPIQAAIDAPGDGDNVARSAKVLRPFDHQYHAASRPHGLLQQFGLLEQAPVGEQRHAAIQVTRCTVAEVIRQIAAIKKPRRPWSTGLSNVEAEAGIEPAWADLQSAA